MSKGHDEKAQLEHDGSKGGDDVGSSRKGRGLLGVPSRGSSQPVQSSSAATGLSGATANEPRDSIGGHSKESKSSRLGRRRNGSASSNRSGAGTVPTGTPGSSQPNSPAGAPQRRKKGGLLALLGCCGVPDNANALEGGEDPLPSHKLDKIPQRPLTSSRRTITPSEQTTASKSQLQDKEKETQSQPQAPSATSPGQDISKPSQPTTSTHDQPTAGDRATETRPTATASTPGPSITVNPPGVEKRERDQATEATPHDVDGDVNMPDADATAASQPAQEPANPADEQLSKPMPPPPPGPIPLAGAAPISQPDMSVVSDDSEPQKFLLPPIEPALKGRKCLVLDLDETLVHSSFKVSLDKSLAI